MAKGAPGLDQALDELYGASLADFIARRDALAKELKASGDASGAAEVKAQRKPTQIAWVLNQLARRHADDLADLVDVGRDLARAQRKALRGEAGSDLRDAIGRQRSAVSALTAKTADLMRELGVAPTEHLDEIAGALQAALVDPAVGAKLEEGRLEKVPETVAGFPGTTQEVEVAEPEPRAGAKAKADAKAKAKAAAKAKADAEARANADVKAKAKADVRARAEAKAREKADAEARAEEERRAKAREAASAAARESARIADEAEREADGRAAQAKKLRDEARALAAEAKRLAAEAKRVGREAETARREAERAGAAAARADKEAKNARAAAERTSKHAKSADARA